MQLELFLETAHCTSADPEPDSKSGDDGEADEEGWCFPERMTEGAKQRRTGVEVIGGAMRNYRHGRVEHKGGSDLPSWLWRGLLMLPGQ